MEENKKKSAFVLGILSLVFAWLAPIIGLILGVIGISMALGMANQANSYQTEKILNSLGIALAIIFWVLRVIAMLA